MKVAPKTDEQKFEPAQGSGEEPTPRDQAASSPQVNSANPAQASLPGAEQTVQTPPSVPPVNPNSPVIPSPPPPPVEPKPAERVESILEAMRRQKDGSSGQFYVVEENPYVINLVAIRKTNEGQPYPNTFSDELWAIWKNDQGNWEHQKWPATTLPGLNVKITENSVEKTYLIKDKFAALSGSEFQETYSTKLKRVVSKGLPILVPAQYDLFEQSGNDEASGEFQGTHFLPKKCACYHDRNIGSSNITFSEPDDFFDKKIDTDCKGVGIFIGFIPTSDRRDLGFSSKSYKDSPHRQPTSVDTWSLGSVVIPNQSDWIQFKDLAIKSIKTKKSSSDTKTKASIKFTLLKESDLT